MASRLTVVLVSLLLATPAVIFWLWLVTLPARMALVCPEECICETGYSVRCSSHMTGDMPSEFPTLVRDLAISNYFIPTLENDTFINRGLTELEEIELDQCEIETIELGAFNGLTEVKVITLINNQISEILPRTFQKLSSLAMLVISHSGIEYLDFDMFFGLMNLNALYLCYNNITYIHPDVFAGLHKLKILALYGNSGLQVPTDSHFINSNSVSHLDISHCNVMSVSFKTFANVTALELLDLSYNNLISLDIDILEILPKLSVLYLYDNPIQCDCQLQEVWLWCQDHNIETAYEENAPLCDTPSAVQGKYWGVLGKGQCLQENITYSAVYENTTFIYTPTENLLWGINIQHFLKNCQIRIYVILCIFGTTCNVFLINIIIHNKDMRTVPNMYILNLAISDIIYLISHFLESYVNVQRTFGDIIFISLAFLRRLSVGLSAYSVAVLSIQRYRVTVNPFHVRVSSHTARRGIIGTVCGVWIVAVLFAIPSAIAQKYISGKNFDLDYYERVVVFELLVSSVLPLCVIGFSYAMTARHVLKSAGPIREDSQSPHFNTRKRTAKTVLGLTFVFLISNVPYHVLWAYLALTAGWYLDKTEVLSDSANEFLFSYTVSTCLLLINSCFNPVSLFCTSRAFKRHLKRYLTCSWKANSSVSNFEVAITN